MAYPFLKKLSSVKVIDEVFSWTTMHNNNGFRH